MTSILGCLEDRIIMIGTTIADDTVANLVTAQMLFLEGKDPDADIILISEHTGRFGFGGFGNLRHNAVY